MNERTSSVEDGLRSIPCDGMEPLVLAISEMSATLETRFIPVYVIVDPKIYESGVRDETLAMIPTSLMISLLRLRMNSTPEQIRCAWRMSSRDGLRWEQYTIDTDIFLTCQSDL